MADVAKVLYLVVVDDAEKGDKRKDGKESFRYTRPVLQSTLQFMGCKPRHAFKISKRVFEVIRSKNVEDAATRINMFRTEPIINKMRDDARMGKAKISQMSGKSERCDSVLFELYKRRKTVVIKRERFLDVVCDALAEYKYMGANQRADLVLACRIRERKESVTVLLCGTSGCGKSTLSSLLGSRLGLTTVISTDSVRHMMRSFVDEKQNPLLWASTYHAGEHLDPVAVAEAKAKKKAKKKDGISRSVSKDSVVDGVSGGKSGTQSPEVSSCSKELISDKQMAIEGYKAQSEMVIDSLDRLITAWEDRKESVIVEGVHLSLNFVMGLMKRHPSIVPFMIYITNEDKHLERFAVRAKYMTLDPARNKYVKYIRNIRTIQEYLCNRADKHLVPKINNTNVDKSVAAIHATLFSCLRKREAGEQLYDPTTNKVSVIYDMYRNQCTANSLSSKGMFQLIQRKGSSRHLMALINTDGSVAKAWPVDSSGNPIMGPGVDNGIGSPMYGHLQIDRAEPINIQFGHFGISAWPSDTGGTSHASSFDESRADLTGTDNGSKNHSSCCSSPRMSDGPAKEPKEEYLIFGSDEEIDETPHLDSDEDCSDSERAQEEMDGGSVDEEYGRSDEEYDDLVMLDMQDKGYLSDDDEDFQREFLPATRSLSTPRIHANRKAADKTELFTRTKSEIVTHSPNPLPEKNRNNSKQPPTKMRKRSYSIPAPGKRGLTGTQPSTQTPQG
ncbi:hypothetical protein V2J09_010903 [Rumex salicifolius]